jgi:hypothetical protein
MTDQWAQFRIGDPWAEFRVNGPALDRATGAPASVRAAVGSAQTPEDRLSTLRRFYPDAQPYGTDNFIFTRNGRPTIYNPRGLDWGDAVSIIPEIGEFLGGAAGGAAAALGTPATGGVSALAIPAGVGLGAAAGREVATLGATWLGNTDDTRSPLRRLMDAGTTAAVNSAALPIADLIGKGARAVWGAVPRVMGPATGPAAIQDFANAGVTPSAGAVTGNRGMQLLEATIEATPGGADPMRALRMQQASELGQSVERTARQFGQPTDPMRAGATVREGAEAAARRFEQRQEALYNRAFSLIGGDRPSSVAAVQRLADDLRADLARAPESRGRVLQPVLARVEALLADAEANGGKVQFDVLRNIRTDLGRELGAPRGAATAPASDARVYLERLYSALSDDIRQAARSAGPDAERALATADRYTRMQRTQNMPALERILADRTDEQVFRLVFPQNGRPDPQALARIRRNLTPEEWGAVQATVLERMGFPTAGTNAGEKFSIDTFLTNWNRLMANGDNARRVLFGGSQHSALAGELDQLVRVAQRIRDAERMKNWSGTARVAGMGAGALLAAQDVIERDWEGLATLGALGIIAPRYAAQLLSDPNTVRWLAGATRVAALRGNVIPDSQWARLIAVGEANPELRDAIQNYRDAFTEVAPTARR